MLTCVLEHPRIRSEKRFNDIANTPLWSCLMGGYAASSLEQAGHEVVFWDATKTRWNFEKTKREVIKLSPDLLCVNAVYIWEHTDKLFAFFSALKKEGFSGHIHLFGFFPTLAWKIIFEETDGVDSISVGECEKIIVALAAALKKNESIKDISGLAHRSSNGNIEFKPAAPERDPNIFPFPKRNDRKTDTISILGSRGCYNHCRFCPIPSFYNQGPLWRGRHPDNIFEEMEMLADKGFKDFYFVDPNFIGPGKIGKERIIELMKRIRPLQITFGMETRPEDLDVNVVDHLVSSGFQSLLMGIESGSSRVLDNLQKHTPLSASEKAIELCRNAGIEPEIGFLMFVPDSTLEDLRHNFDFLTKNNLLERLEITVNMLSHRQIVFMGTSGYKMFEKQGRLKRTGFLGFEGKVSCMDKDVNRISEILVQACHFVLRQMEKPDASINWQNLENNSVGHQVNNYLVNLFDQLVTDAARRVSIPETDEFIKDIETDLKIIIRSNSL